MLNVFDHPRGAHLHSLHLFWVGFNFLVRNHKTKELPRGDAKGTLGRVNLHLVLAQGGEGFSEIVDVDPSDFTLDEHIIYILMQDG